MQFLERARVDHRLGPMHITLYMAIYYCFVRQGGGSVYCTAGDLAVLAKVNRSTPFYRRLKQLDRYGYIKYEPSYNPAVKSRVTLVFGH
jgi:hypothetical protein